ncbi:hypothetical protein Lesp02_29780 [Lentzea sp. NBRC 105346]|uniref:ImmA/IrrE family metallo-endopeptidase n=1 Tax=Lentzea sp. NBRC 105346 TaxID=3032205 RepID=UPI0024A59D0C|nr:ImmA/IrrE family metallo-endopeptidase [Lentzea sp. NBRC 105346]GLZ30789.1 hypothetical protein Lesp02_29780 [Lentzea sp. NBRC 105346]
MATTTKKAVNELITSLRSLAPKRAISYGEAIQVARLQAARFRRWAEADQPDINLIWLIEQRAVPVHFVPAHKLSEESGLTTNAVGGKVQVFINQNEPLTRQRFSLLHEFKHVLDFTDGDHLYERLGSGDQKRKELQMELICNHFAAHVLMPTALVKSHWFATQNVDLMAGLFNVSPEAMSKRLRDLGLIERPEEKPRTYFRQAGAALGDALCCAA